MIINHFLNRAILLVVVFEAANCLDGHAANVVYVEKAQQKLLIQQQTKTAANFYGVGESVILVTGKGEQPTVIKAIRDPKTIAVVLTADVLPSLDGQQVLIAMRRKDAGNIPLLISGINAHTDAELLKRWSGGAITGCKASTMEKGSGSYTVSIMNGVTAELGGHTLPMNQGDVNYLILEGIRGERIIAAASGTRELPVFVRVRIGPQEIFFATANEPVEMPVGSGAYRELLEFASLAPQMMFLRYGGGERAWHSPGHYANLTIDDAWLREPYGYVNYEGLLGEMERHNFHTTIAFVPWNFDRSQPAVVSLFRTHGDRFSICIHGNNHDHQEFGAYDHKPLSGQTNDVKQGLARMARLRELTQLPYDPVMVFPHSISPEQTLAVLKRYSFWATANSLNVPMNAKAPSDVEFVLRPATMAFSNFPSLRRYSAEVRVPESQLAVDAFLGNPMLFYVHQAFFASGIDAFDKTADTVNQLQPDTQWRSLGDIVQHLYLEKQRDDGNYDVRAYSGTVSLHNDHKRDSTFFVEKEEDFLLPLTVFVDGQPYPYERSGATLKLRLSIASGSSREITIKYMNDLNIAGIDISKGSLRIQGIRRLSDFRDDVVSKTEMGRFIIRLYVKNEARWNDLSVAIAVLLAVAVTLWLARRAKGHSMAAQDSTLPLRTTVRDGSDAKQQVLPRSTI